MNILSIQSWVSYGHVGNGSAMFPLQRLGAEVWAVNTVQFSNHPGYGAYAGEVFAPAALRAQLNAIADRLVLPGCDALLSGYVGDAGTGDVILEAVGRLRAANGSALWCCDPVIGDVSTGIYVRPGVPDFFRERAVPQADLLTPNQFELECLTGQPCGTLEQMRKAVGALQARMPAAGPRTVLVTSVHVEDTPADAIDCLAGAQGRFHRVRLPLLPIAVNGAGDAMAALFLFHMLASGDVARALEASAASIHGLLSYTLAAGSRELCLVGAQEEFVRPSQVFLSEEC